MQECARASTWRSKEGTNVSNDEIVKEHFGDDLSALMLQRTFLREQDCFLFPFCDCASKSRFLEGIALPVVDPVTHLRDNISSFLGCTFLLLDYEPPLQALYAY